MSKKARVFSREFKLMVVRRLLAGERMSVIARETQVLRKDLYIWRDRYRGGGAEALRGSGRPRKGEELTVPRDLGRDLWRSQRLAPLASALPSWSARSASSRSNSIFFSEPCGRSGKRAGGAAGLAGRGLRRHPSDDDLAAARRTHDRADVRGCLGSAVPAITGTGRPRRRAGKKRRLRDAIQRLALATGITAIGGSRRSCGREGWRVNHKRVLRLMRRGQSAVSAAAAVRAGHDRFAPWLAGGAEPGARPGADRARPALGGRHHLCASGGGVRLSCRSCSMPSAVASSAGPWRRTCRRASPLRRSTWRLRRAGPRPAA